MFYKLAVLVNTAWTHKLKTLQYSTLKERRELKQWTDSQSPLMVSSMSLHNWYRSLPRPTTLSPVLKIKLTLTKSTALRHATWVHLMQEKMFSPSSTFILGNISRMMALYEEFLHTDRTPAPPQKNTLWREFTYRDSPPVWIQIANYLDLCSCRCCLWNVGFPACSKTEGSEGSQCCKEGDKMSQNTCVITVLASDIIT